MNKTKPLSYNPLKIFISSSWQGELDDVNRIAIETIYSLGLQPITGDGVSNFSPILHCSRKVKEGDILIVFLGKELRPIVRRECDTALQNNIPILGFIRKVEKDPVLTKYINFLSKYITYHEFSDVEQLRDNIKYALIENISENFRKYRIIYKKILDWILDGPLFLSHYFLESLKKDYGLNNDEFFKKHINNKN